MCGINGILVSHSIVNRDEIILRMNQALIHRGPDAGNSFHDEHISLGHRRLSIIGLDESGNQPMKSTDGRIVLVFNGEIYNYKALKSLTPNYQFFSHTDTEVIIALYQSFGFEKMLELIDGMFAIALWDSDKTKLFLARDRFGKKPLYYSIVDDAQGGSQIVFSSEIRGLLASKLFTPKLNKEVLGEYLQIQCVREPNTFLTNVHQLESSHWVSFECGQLKKDTLSLNSQTRYWKLKSSAELRCLNKVDALKKFKELLYESVEKRMVSDVSVGAFLSGGLDSSAIVIAMAEMSSNPINTVCIDSDKNGFEESRFANLIAKRYGTNHKNIVLTQKSFYSEFDDALMAMDHPSLDIFNSYIVSKHMKSTGVTVALNGTGGDEILGGYAQFNHTYKVNQFLKYSPINKLVNLGSKIQLGEQILRNTKFYKYSRFIDYPYSNYADYNLRLRSLVYGGQTVEKIKIENKHTDRIYSTLTELEFEYYLKPMLLKDIDSMSMAHSLEVRTPFLDPRLVEFCYSISDNFKHTNQPKQFLIDSLKSKLPLEIQNRKKQGFSFPKSHWESESLTNMVLNGLKTVKEVDCINNLATKLISTHLKWTNRDAVIARLLAVLGHWIKNNNIAID